MKTYVVTLAAMLGALVCAGRSPQLKLAYEMQTAVLKTQDIRAVQQLLDRGVDVNAPIGCGTYSPFDGAIDTHNVQMLQFLLAHKAKPTGGALSRVAFAPHPQAVEMTKLLLQAGADPNPPSDPPLPAATFRENQELVALLLSQPNIKVDAADVDGYTALMWAVEKGSAELVDMLLRAGARVDTPTKHADSAITVGERQIAKQRTIIERLKAASK